MSDEMRLWYLADGFRRRGRNERWIQQYIAGTARLRRHDKELIESDKLRCMHTVVMQDEVFELAALTNPEWVSEMADRIEQSNVQTKLHVCDKVNWAEVTRAVCEPTNFWDYCTVDVFDEHVALLSPTCGGATLAVRERTRVRAIREAIEKSQSLVQSKCDSALGQLRTIVEKARKKPR